MANQNGGSNAITTATFSQELETRKDWLSKVLPKHITPERMIKIALLARSRDPGLMQCTQESLLRAILQCAEVGLEPTGAVGGAYLIPRQNKHTGKMEATVIFDYRGLMDLARRSGKIRSLEAHVIHAKDKFHVAKGTRPYIEHEPALSADPGEVVAVYAVARLKGNPVPQFDVMTKAEVDAIRSRSPAAKSGPWVTDYEAMARKTVVRRLSKFLPRSYQLSQALEYEESEPGEIVDVVASEPVMSKPQTKTEKLKAKLQELAAEQPPPLTDEEAPPEDSVPI